ncbi:non-ribosomal peptide synthetase [Amycolatopsis pigmentata]|uniref:Amino acid adenylation domain-containing protein n=1 Tax=Amycolatopsis pigmentata TaxID=450801 RepID=A0ABW5FWP6_9PSEU
MSEAGADGVVGTESDLGFWRRTLAGVRPPDLPTDRARLDGRDSGSGSVPFTVRADIVAGIRRVAATHDCSVFVVLLSVFQALLNRYTGQPDIAIATPAEPSGTRANTLLIRADLSGDPVVGDLLARATKATLDAFAHRSVPFESLPADVRAEYDLARTPLFQLDSVPAEPATAFDLALTFVEQDGGLTAGFRYSGTRFDQATVRRMAGHYQTLLANVIADPPVRLSDLELLTPSERAQLLVEWNDTEADFPRDVCVHELVGRQAAAHPDAVAVVSAMESLTYGELTARANQLARFLAGRRAGPDVLVGVCLPRSLDLVVALLGVLRAGAAYVPMDPEYPAQRLAFLLSDAAAPVVLTHSGLRDRLPAGDVVLMDEDWSSIGALPDTDVATGVRPDNLAYVIYTSGSTGEPKGVQVEHQGLVNLVDWHRRTFGIGPGKRTTLASPMAFDAMAWDLWSALAAGATVSIPSAQTVEDPQQLQRWINDECFDVTFLPTPVAEAVLALPWSRPAPGYLLTGGDRLTTIPRANLPFVLVNNYGPTETTVVATSGTVSYGRPVHIGRPVQNVVVYVVDHADHLVPIGVPGELLIGGVGVARGYLNRPELTAQRFTADPFSSDHGARVYRTGDIVRWTPDGNLEFVGRRDDQVKVRGFRVEPGEVESVLAGRRGVASCAVTVREDLPGSRRLVAYCVPADGVSLCTTALREWCEHSLPAHLVPSVFVLLPKLPLAANGKVDRTALPAPDGIRPDLSNGFVAPRSPAERTVAKIWSDILWVDEIGVHDDFFELGGDSLLAARVISRVRDELGIDIAIRTLFDSPVLGRFTTALAHATHDMMARRSNSPAGPEKTESLGGQL